MDKFKNRRPTKTSLRTFASLFSGNAERHPSIISCDVIVIVSIKERGRLLCVSLKKTPGSKPRRKTECPRAKLLTLHCGRVNRKWFTAFLECDPPIRCALQQPAWQYCLEWGWQFGLGSGKISSTGGNTEFLQCRGCKKTYAHRIHS